MKKTPAATAKRLESPRQLRALIAIQQQPQTVRGLMDRAGGNGIPQLVDALRKKGLKIDTTWHRGLDRDERFIRYCTYVLSPESAQLADQLIEDFVKRGV
jgi:hypothetical protein